MSAPMVDAALGLASGGWPVLPLAGKVPRTAAGFKDATLDPARIKGWWARWPSANIGIALPVTVLVIDVDPRNGGDQGMARLEARHGPLPATATVVSGRGDGGRHHYFARPNGPLTGRGLPEGIDLKVGGRGYVVAPPSLHPATGRPYRWERLGPIAPPPRWLTGLLTPAPPPPRPERHQPSGHGSMPWLVRHVTDLTEGNRNAGLYWAACRAAEHGMLDQMAPDLAAAARTIGLDDREIAAVLGNARRQGAA